MSLRFCVPAADILERVRETKAQVELDKRQRRGNVAGAFALRLRLGPMALRPPAIIRGKNIVLVDDVYTTGATMGECARILKKAGAKEVWGMVLALD